MKQAYMTGAIDLPRGKPRSFVEWKTLRRWGQLPFAEQEVPGYLLRLAREEGGFTQKALAAELGITQQAVAQAERWTANPTISFVRSWARACGRELSLRLEAPDERPALAAEKATDGYRVRKEKGR
jgi:DNA-binding XRE family transcriptional regulator